MFIHIYIFIWVCSTKDWSQKWVVCLNVARRRNCNKNSSLINYKIYCFSVNWLSNLNGVFFLQHLDNKDRVKMELRVQVMEHHHTRITTEAKTRVNGWVTMDWLACFKQGGHGMAWNASCSIENHNSLELQMMLKQKLRIVHNVECCIPWLTTVWLKISFEIRKFVKEWKWIWKILMKNLRSGPVLSA